MAKRTVEQILAELDLDTAEHTYIIDCLKSAVSYCKAQYEDSEIDWLPTVDCIGLEKEADKFELLYAWLQTL